MVPAVCDEDPAQVHNKRELQCNAYNFCDVAFSFIPCQHVDRRPLNLLHCLGVNVRALRRDVAQIAANHVGNKAAQTDCRS